MSSEEKNREKRIYIYLKTCICKQSTMFQKHVHTVKCQFDSERIVPLSFSKELHQIVGTLFSRHLSEILPFMLPKR